jgi:hypothetical protein
MAPGLDFYDVLMRLSLARCKNVELRAWTGLTWPQMRSLVEQLWERKPDAARGRNWELPSPDRVLLLVLAYRTNLTMQQLASLFGTTGSSLNPVVAWVDGRSSGS